MLRVGNYDGELDITLKHLLKIANIWINECKKNIGGSPKKRDRCRYSQTKMKHWCYENLLGSIHLMQLLNGWFYSICSINAVSASIILCLPLNPLGVEHMKWPRFEAGRRHIRVAGQPSKATLNGGIVCKTWNFKLLPTIALDCCTVAIRERKKYYSAL